MGKTQVELGLMQSDQTIARFLTIHCEDNAVPHLLWALASLSQVIPLRIFCDGRLATGFVVTKEGMQVKGLPPGVTR